MAYVKTSAPDAQDFSSELWVAGLDGGDAKRVARSSVRYGSPAWSPDGQRIAYGDGLGISIAKADGSGTSQIISLLTAEALDWSPDGKLLVVGGLGLRGIGVVDLESGSEWMVTKTVFDSEPRWSPDGREIAFIRYAKVGLEGSIFIVRAEGGTPRRVTSGHADVSPVWSPDGALIAFSRSPLVKMSRLADPLKALKRQEAQREIYVAAPDGSGLRRLTQNQVPDRSPEWGDPKTVSRSLTPAQKLVTVPDVRGLTERAARSKLANRGFRATLRDLALTEGERDPLAQYRVVTQAPSAGASATRGRVVQLLVLDQSDKFAGRPFDAGLWRRHPTCESDNPRGRMYANLVQTYLPRGMPQDDVVDLLGKPPHREPRRFDYPLGAWSGFRIDCDYLSIEFDKARRLVATSHFQS